MCPNIFRFPFVENRPRALGATSFISLVFHGLLLGATGLAIPLKTATPPGAMQPDRKVEQVASKAPIGESSPPAPAGGSGKPRPQYPERARKRGQEGTVSVRCQVDANGHVTNVSLARSSGFRLLDEAALKAVGKWKFKPGRKDGADVAGTVVVPVQFRLQ